MKVSFRSLSLLGAFAALLLGDLGVSSLAGDKAPATGPATEKRFPPLKVPAQFKATLFACDPLVEYLSAVAVGPKPGTLFVAADFMTGLGTKIVRRDEIRLVEDTDGDGYADKATVFARGFNSIQGLTYHNGTLYVMHAPFLTALRDTQGKGVADQRKDLLTGLGLTPEENPVRLHCANGLVMGHDGWLYLALGDHGCKIERPEGDRLVLEGGGILRCRPDGRDLHIFASGLRNIYDVALDAELNVFVRDNENDGGDYKIRVCHSFFGADHGYPYLYYERPEEALPPLADLGLGSSAGGLCYLERQFPPEYRGNLFFCEWGRAVVRYPLKPAGSGFAPVKEIDFAAGAANDPYGFKPTDLVVERDGSLIVVDWADDQRPMRGRGRIYRIRHVGDGKAFKLSPPLPKNADMGLCLKRLDSASYHERCEAQTIIEARGQGGLKTLTEVMANNRIGARGRLHAVWILAHAGGRAALDPLFNLAGTDPEPGVRVQAIRAIADLADPVFTKHRLDAMAEDATVATRLARLAVGGNTHVFREVVIALGRLKWAGTPAWLQKMPQKPDAALAHAVMQTLRRLQDWPAVLRFLDGPTSAPLRTIALRASADRPVPALVDGLIERLGKDPNASRRREYADLLTRVYKKPSPWVYWGYRPPPRPANTVPWEKTEAIERALDKVLADSNLSVRLAILKRMQREKVPARLATLGRWLREERQTDRVALLIESLRERPAQDIRADLTIVVKEKKHAPANRLAALALIIKGLDRAGEKQLVDLAGAVEDGPVFSAILQQLGKRPGLEAGPLLLRKLESAESEVRAAALQALAELKSAEAGEAAARLLQDKDARVRRAAAMAAGRLGMKPAAGALLKLARDPDPTVRRASLDALGALREPRALPLAIAALTDRETEQSALEVIAVLGGPDQAGTLADLAKRNHSAEILFQVVRTLTAWQSLKALPAPRRLELGRSVAELQGSHGVLLRWQVRGPVAPDQAARIVKQIASFKPASTGETEWRTVLAAGPESPVSLESKGGKGVSCWLAYTDVVVPEQTPIQLLAAAQGTLRVWLNGRLAHQRASVQPFLVDSDRFSATLAKGANRIVVQITSTQGPARAHLRFRRISSKAENEKLFLAALTRAGDPQRGRTVFFNIEKSQCLKCHRLGDQGERIGPELTGVGGRFSRIHIIESILEPSRTIAPSYQTWRITMKDGRQLMGVKAAETDKALTLGDQQGKKYELVKVDIDEQRPLPQSTMPDGLEKRLTAQEFIDLVAFLTSQKRG